ncbi:MAG: L-threonylcarbamoyladenylate synthase [Candidatus Riflebacteria bacterium]|nr:L-threonylcarbamoyladenylate synthase [Candidatus Riflebacteria bacterium]
MKRVKIGQLLADQSLLHEFFADVRAGAVVVLPTDTLYGFAVDAGNAEAVARVYKIKSRSDHKPLILFVHDIDEIAGLGIDVSSEARRLLEKFWPGALTAVLPAVQHPLISAFAFKNIGIRIPDHFELLQLLARLPGKLLTTSANRSGEPSDVDPDNIAAEFAGEVDWFLDGGLLTECVPSTVADFSVLPPLILRQGKIKL